MMSLTNTPQTLAQAPISNEDADRQRKMRDAWKAYRGEFPKPLKIEPNQPDDNVISNHMEPIVTKSTSFLFGPTLKIEATDEAAAIKEQADAEQASAEAATPPAQPPQPKQPPKPGEPPQPVPVAPLPPPAPKPKPKPKPKPGPIQTYIDGLWGGDDDTKMTLLSELAINGGVCGQVFLKLIPPRSTAKFPRLVVLNPEIVRIIADPEDCKLVLAFVIEYPGQGELQKRQIIARVDPDGLVEELGNCDPDDYWTITNYVRKGQTGNWMQMGASEVWDWPFPPIFTAPNLPNPNEKWGSPDLTQDLIDENKALNFLFSTLARIIKFHGHPKTVAMGVVSSQITMAIDDMVCLPDPTSKIEMLAAMENFGGILSVIASLMSNIDEQSRVPGVALGRLVDLPKGNISGVALKLLFQSLIEKTIQKQRLYGKLIREVTRAALVMAGLISVQDFEDYTISLHWQNLLPVDDLAAAQTAQILQALGVSTATILQELGYNSEDEANKTEVEQANKPKPPVMMMPPTLPGQPGQQPNENVA